MIYDLKGGFGSLRKINALYESEVGDTSRNTQGLWDQGIVRQYETPVQQSEYQERLEMGLPTFQLKDRDIRYWSDFNRVFYHPRSAVQLSQYELNSEMMPFEVWSNGEELWEELDKGVDLMDRDLRPFAEECDSMQGIQMIGSVDDAWGGFAARYIDGLRDEYGEKTSVWVWALEDTRRADVRKKRIREGNKARSLARMGKTASAYVRMANVPNRLLGYVHLGGEGDWRTTALMCSAFESVTLPTRLAARNTNTTTLNWLEDLLNTNGNQRLLDLQLSLGPSVTEHANGVNGSSNGVPADPDRMDVVSSSTYQLDLSFFPSDGEVSGSGHVFAWTECRRTKDKTPASETSLEEQQRTRLNEETVVKSFQSDLLFPLLDTFPNDLFRTKAGEKELALNTSLCTNVTMKSLVTSLRDRSIRTLELDEREPMYNDLSELANGYSFGWESGSDSGEDT